MNETNRPSQPAKVRSGARVLILLPLVAVVVAVGLWAGNRPHLIWKGKSAEYWIARMSFYESNDAVSAEEFLFAAGPEVVPELLAGLPRPDSWIHDLWVKTYFKLGNWQRYFEMPTKRSQYRANCARGLAILGITNAVAETELFRALEDPDEWVRSAAVEGLSRVAVNKDKVVSALVSGLQSTNSNFRLGCIIALVRLLPGSREACEALRHEETNTDFNVRAWIGQGLGRDDTAPTKSFDVLQRLLQDPNPAVRSTAAQGLGKLNFSPETKTRELISALKSELARPDKNEIVIWKIEGALGEIGPPAAASVPLLTSLTTLTNTSQTLAVVALSQIEPQEARWEQMLIDKLSERSTDLFPARELGRRGARVAFPALRKLAQEGELSTAHMAALSAWRIDHSSPDPFENLGRFLLQEERNAGQYELVEVLGELGPNVRVMIPALQHLRYSRGGMLRDHAEAALAKIDREYLANPWKIYAETK